MRRGCPRHAPKSKCGPGQPPRPHSFVVSCSALSPPDGGMTASARQRSEGVPHLPKPAAGSSSCDHKPATVTVASGPDPAPCFKEQRARGEEAATPGQPVALARVFWSVRRRFTLENRRLAAGSAAIIRQAQELSRFADPTLRQIVAPRNTKNWPRCAEAVEDASSLWKPLENLRRNAGVSEAGARSRNPERMRRIPFGRQRTCTFNNLHVVKLSQG